MNMFGIVERRDISGAMSAKTAIKAKPSRDRHRPYGHTSIDHFNQAD
jgi:hypothetical protein